MEWKKEFNFFVFLIVLMLSISIFASYGLFDKKVIGASVGILSLIFAMHLAKDIIFEDKKSRNIFASAEYSLLLVLSSIFLCKVFESLNLSTTYADYVAGLGFLLASALVFITGVNSIIKKLM